MTCRGRQYSDQMVCKRCGYQWDINDVDPPKCKTTHQIGVEALEAIRQSLKNPPK